MLSDYKGDADDLDLGVIYRVLQLAQPELADDPSQLAAQLRARLLKSERPAIKSLHVMWR